MILSRALGYAQRSASEVGLDPYAFETQTAWIAEFCRQRGWALVDVLTEETSPEDAVFRRPVLTDALARLGEGHAEVLVVARADRIGVELARFHFLGWLAQRGLHFAAADVGWDTSTPEGAHAAGIFVHLADQSLWQLNARETPRWDSRNVALAKHIAPGSAVLDLGAGAQTLRDHLPSDCVYQPCDLVESPGVLRCDFNAGIWPRLDRHYDVAVVSGVIEYVHEPRPFLERLPATADCVLLTHLLLGEEEPPVRSPTWPTRLTQRELEGILDELGHSWERVGDSGPHAVYALDGRR